jgi:PLP dependent protein
MASIQLKLQQLRQRIGDACTLAERPVQSVTLLAVSKTQCADAVRQAHAAGQLAFGENYVQEALVKIDALGDLRAALEWHLIGPLQSNKTREVAAAFDWVHTVDRLKIAERLSAQRPEQLPPLHVCVQVNVSGEASKAGVDPGEVLALARAVSTLPRLRLRGLMSIPEPVDAEQGIEAQRAPHRRLRELFDMLRSHGLALDTLSMGMSADLEAAIAEGSTMVRVGSALFGARPGALLG